jgi:hypothetical protein
VEASALPIKLKPTDILVSILMESLLIYLSLVPFGGGDNPWLFAKPFAIMLAASLVLFAVFQLLMKWDSFTLNFIASLAVFALGLALGLTIIISFLTAMFLLWRLTDALNGNTLNHLWIVYMVTLCLSFLYIIFLGVLNMDFPHRSWFIILFFIQTFLTVLLHFLQVAKNGQFGKKMSTSYTLTFGGIILIALLFAGIGPFVSKILGFVIAWIGLAVFYVVQFFWRLIMAISSRNFESIFKEMKKANDQQADKTHKLAEASIYHQMNHNTIIGVIFVIIVGLIVFFYLRKKWHRDGNRKVSKDIHRQAFNGEMKRSIGWGGKKAKIKAPKDRVRLEIFQLQKRWAEQKEGRIGYETMGEWLGRIPSLGREFSIIRKIYEKVRYGKKAIDEAEWNRYHQAMTTVKEQIKKPEKKKTSLWEK